MDMWRGEAGVAREGRRPRARACRCPSRTRSGDGAWAASGRQGREPILPLTGAAGALLNALPQNSWAFNRQRITTDHAHHARDCVHRTRSVPRQFGVDLPPVPTIGNTASRVSGRLHICRYRPAALPGRNEHVLRGSSFDCASHRRLAAHVLFGSDSIPCKAKNADRWPVASKALLGIRI